MILSQRHMSVTLLLAMLLHGGVAVWFSLPEPETRVPVKPPLRVNLLATIAETSVNAMPEPVEPPPPEEVKPEPVVEKKPVKEVKKTPEPVPEPEPVAEVVEEVTPPSPVTPAPVIMDAAATVRYEQLLVAWLEKHKHYPRRAKRLRIEGEGMLRILIDRSGHTRQVSLAQRTGNRLLDKAALAMAQRANPFPAMPENDPRREFEFVVPVAFVLR